MNAQNEDDTQRQKKMKETRLTAKYLPYLALLFVAITVDQLYRSAGHWRMGTLLHVVGPLGGVMYCFSHWQEARCLLRGEPKMPFLACRVLGLMLMVSGPSLADMYPKQRALFQIFGVAMLIVSAVLLSVILLEIWEAWQKRSTHRNTAL